MCRGGGGAYTEFTMPDPNDPPPGRPIDAWFDADPPATAPPVPSEPVELEADLPLAPVVPVARTRLPDVRTDTGPRVNPRPLDAPRRSPRDEPARETDRPRAQVLLACSVLIAVVAAMIVAVAILGYALIAGFKKAKERAKQQQTNRGVLVQPQNNGRVPNFQRAPRPPANPDND